MTQLSSLRLDRPDAFTFHAVISTSVALCGVKPARLSNGWYITEGDEVTCARCRRKLVKALEGKP